MSNLSAAAAPTSDLNFISKISYYLVYNSSRRRKGKT